MYVEIARALYKALRHIEMSKIPLQLMGLTFHGLYAHEWTCDIRMNSQEDVGLPLLLFPY